MLYLSTIFQFTMFNWGFLSYFYLGIRMIYRRERSFNHIISVSKVWMFIYPQVCYCVSSLKNWTTINIDFMGNTKAGMNLSRLAAAASCEGWVAVNSHTLHWCQKLYSPGTAIWSGPSTVPRSLSHWANSYLHHFHSFLNTIHPFPYYILYTCVKLPIHRI